MKLVKPSNVDGEIKAPPSKSLMQRVVAASVLSGSTVRILNPSLCEDSLAALGVAETLGAKVSAGEGCVIIKNGIGQGFRRLDCGESGLCMRMFTAVSALRDAETELSGGRQLLNRPVSNIELPLKDLGADCRTNRGMPPVTVRGVIKGGNATIDGSCGSQFLTGLLITLPLAERNSILMVENLRSRPYIDMTLKMLADLDIEIESENYRCFSIRGGQRYDFNEYIIEGDWSGSSFMLVAGAIAGKVAVRGLAHDSRQGDRRMIDALRLAGAEPSLENGTVGIKRSILRSFHFDATDCPDLFPPLAALACCCQGVTTIKGTSRLKHKESDRGEALAREFTRLGAAITIAGDVMVIEGKPLRGGRVDSHGDHRIAMALAIAALRADGRVLIDGSHCVRKSYPAFFEDLRSIGGEVDE